MVGNMTNMIPNVQQGFFAVITGQSGNNFSWQQVQHDSIAFWPRDQSWWPDITYFQADRETGYESSDTFKNLARSFKTEQGRILSPAREINNTPVPVGSVVWIWPTYNIEPKIDPTETDSPIYLFSFSNLGPYAVRFSADSIPKQVGKDKYGAAQPIDPFTVQGYFLADPYGKTFTFYPESTGYDSQLYYETGNGGPLLCEVIRQGGSDDWVATQGWVQWVPRAYQAQTPSGPAYFGQWQIVSTNSSTEFMGKIRPSGATEPNHFLPNTKQTCDLWWVSYADPTQFVFSGYQIEVINPTQSTFEEGDRFSIYYDKQPNCWFVYTPTTSSDHMRWAKVQTGFVNTDAAAITNCSVKTCKSDGSAVTGNAFDVKTPIRANKATALFEGYVIGWLFDEAGDKFIVTDTFDDRMNTVKLWDALWDDIPTGWEELVTAQGRYIVGVDVTHELDETGGDQTHTHDLHTHTGDNGATGTARMGTCQLLADHVHVEANHEPPWLGLYYIIRSS